MIIPNLGRRFLMRKHGRLMKNIAGLLLLLALLSLLLPFCKFNAGDGNMTLSGIEVIKTGGKAGYTYFKEGRLSENYVIKAPYTWGDIRDSVSYINHAGGANILVFCAVAIAVPLVLCFLSMFMLFMAEGKKTMFMPTLFTLVVVAEMLLIVFGITPLRPFLKIGVYLFTILNVIALLFIIAGWITGGYRHPDNRQSRYGYGGKGDTSKDGDDGNNNRSHRRKRRKTRRKTKKKKKTQKDKSSDGDNKKENNEDSENKEKKVSGEPVTGVISNGSGIYHGLSWNLKDGKDASVTIGTTFDAVEALESGSLRGIDSIAENNCRIVFDAAAKQYNIESHSKQAVLILQDGKVVKWLKNGDSYAVTSKAVLQVDGRRDAVKLG
jgi:hypothetical protein